MEEEEYHKDMFQGIGVAAKKNKTLGERPVDDKDIQEIHDDLNALRDDLTELKAKGEEVF